LSLSPSYAVGYVEVRLARIVDLAFSRIIIFLIPSTWSTAMRKLNLAFWSTLFAAAAFNQALAQSTSHAGQAAKDGVAASGHASASAAHSVAASGQVTSAMFAVPLLSGAAAMGSAGAVSATAGRDSLRAATAPIGTPLAITDEAITVVPPNEALKSKATPTKL
jgi:hypothetical protein